MEMELTDTKREPWSRRAAKLKFSRVIYIKIRFPLDRWREKGGFKQQDIDNIQTACTKTVQKMSNTPNGITARKADLMPSVTNETTSKASGVLAFKPRDDGA